VQIFNSSFENMMNQYFIYGVGIPNTNYSVILQNINFNNFSVYSTMILIGDINMIIVNSTFANIPCNNGDFISSGSDPNSNFFVIFQNTDFNNVNSSIMIYLSETILNMVNSTLEDNSCEQLLSFYSTTILSFKMQNIKISRNDISLNGIFISGGINLILDTFEFNKNYNGEIGFQIESSVGQIAFLNSVVFTNNYVGKLFNK